MPFDGGVISGGVVVPDCEGVIGRTASRNICSYIREIGTVIPNIIAVGIGDVHAELHIGHQGTDIAAVDEVAADDGLFSGVCTSVAL